MTEPESEDTITMSLRLPVDLANWVESQAKDLCNSKNGIVKLAVTKLKAATEQAQTQPQDSAA